MTPTNKLRFIERSIPISTSNNGVITGTRIKVLQQWFAYDINYPTEKGEWRDVPTVMEEKK
jgi:hypothetical protein